MCFFLEQEYIYKNFDVSKLKIIIKKKLSELNQYIFWLNNNYEKDKWKINFENQRIWGVRK